MERFQKLALAALISVLLLLVVGAIVRVTGSGLGCPDWPTCWGRLIPPTSVEQVDFDSIDMEKFRRKAERHGRDPMALTRDSLREEFNPMHTWVEYINRLCSMPVGILTLTLMIVSFRQGAGGSLVRWMSVAAFVVVLINADLGRRVVLSGLKPGVITLHMALAILLLCILVYVSWRGRGNPLRRTLSGKRARMTWLIGFAVFVLTVAEGVLGAQVRELTDEFARDLGLEARSEWTAALENSAVYLAHRSFSWLIAASSLVFLIFARKSLTEGMGWPEKAIGCLVGSLMVMGLVLSQVGVLPVVQVLHVGVAALLVTILFFWLLATRPTAT